MDSCKNEEINNIEASDAQQHSTTPSAKKPMTHEERLQLAAKLDKELDDFIEKLPRKKYEDGWPEDRWEEVVNLDYITSFLLFCLSRKWIDIPFL